MSRRQRDVRARPDASARPGFAATNEAWSASARQLPPSRLPPSPVPPPQVPRRSGHADLVAARVSFAALLPLRFFVGATFLYAGLDKLLDPGFFDPAGGGSIQAQLAGFVRFSPIGPLVHLVEPLAVPIGFLIAFAEIAIGLGALTGLAYRLAAAAGVALSLLFWLTASWNTTPYYFGPDLPYAVGWLTLALAGHGDFLVVRLAWLARWARPTPAWPRSPALRAGGAPRRGAAGRDLEPESPTRRTFLEVALLAGATLAVAALAAPLRVLGVTLTNSGGAGATGAGTTGVADTTPRPTGGAGGPPRPSGAAGNLGPTPVATRVPAATPTTGDLAVGKVSEFASASAVPFTVPFDAPAPLPAGDPAVIVKLADGSFVAFDAVCTHQGCTVEWDGQDGVLLCPCHGAAFDPAQRARVVQGPARRPLAAIPLQVNSSTGEILLKG